MTSPTCFWHAFGWCVCRFVDLLQCFFKFLKTLPWLGCKGNNITCNMLIFDFFCWHISSYRYFVVEVCMVTIDLSIWAFLNHCFSLIGFVTMTDSKRKENDLWKYTPKKIKSQLRCVCNWGSWLYQLDSALSKAVLMKSWFDKMSFITDKPWCGRYY